MSESEHKPESQKERWLKYGVNVLLTVIVVIALAVVVSYAAERQNKRFDTTSDQQYSLKPQTVNIIKDLTQPIRLVSLYHKPETEKPGDTDYSGAVADLLDEYKSEGRNIEVEVIDPVRDPTKVDSLIADVTNKYGGEVKKYRDFVDGSSRYFDPIRQFTTNENAKLAALPIDRMKNDDVDQTLASVMDTMAALPTRLDKVKKAISALQTQKVPDYKGAADTIHDELTRISDIAEQISATFPKLRDDPKYAANLTPAIKQYLTDSAARFADLKKQVDASTNDYKALGELKLDDLRQKLRERDAILVMGPRDMRSLSFDQVWQANTDKRAYQGQTNATIKPKFAGEQQITSAILQLTADKKPKVVFIRPGGAPLTSPGFPPFQPGGPFSKVADRLRDYNFDVLEKDLSGQYAMQAQMQGEPAAPEPSDDEIKDAVWVVLDGPTNPQAPSPPLAPKLADHLKSGGAALILASQQGDNLSAALSDWGVDLRTDLLIVHEAVKTAASSDNYINEAEKLPYIFVLHDFGDALITRPLNSLDGVLVPLIPVITTPKAGYTASPLIPIPQTTPVWATHNPEGAFNGDDVKFDPAQGDLGPPLFGGAMVQNDKGARLVAIGSVQFIHNQLLSMPDTEMAQRGIPAARFPANAELFCNSIFWLSHMEPLIAISPSAMDVNRIGPMSDASLKAWRVGGLLIGLPGAVIVLGLMVYFARKD